MSSTEDLKKAAKESILKRIPLGAEASKVLVGAVDFLEQPTIAFVRLAEGIFMPSITEVSVGSRLPGWALFPQKVSNHSILKIWIFCYFLHLPIASIKVITSILINRLIWCGCNETYSSCPVHISLLKNFLNYILCQIQLQFRSFIYTNVCTCF